MISQRAKYGLRAVVALARAEGRSMTIVEIAAREKIPRKFLEQILLQLKNAGILASRRGKLGGYALGRPADAITFGEILRLIDGPIAPLPCLSKFSYRRCADCLDESSCEVRRVFSGVAESARAGLDRTSLADSLSENRAILPLAGK
jgi:Rrf2 family protein